MDFASTTNSEQCTSSLAIDALTSSCNGVRDTPLGRLTGTLTGRRVTPAASIFGELGGTWHLTDGTGSADVAVTRNTFSAATTKLGFAPGTATVDVKVCKGKAVGKSSAGAEFVATLQ